jgi:hypothetical protein
LSFVNRAHFLKIFLNHNIGPRSRSPLTRSDYVSVNELSGGLFGSTASPVRGPNRFLPVLSNVFKVPVPVDWPSALEKSDAAATTGTKLPRFPFCWTKMLVFE